MLWQFSGDKEVRMVRKFTSIFSRFLFVVAFMLGVLAVCLKVARLFGSTVLAGQYEPFHLLEISAIALLFIAALQLREIKILLSAKGSD
jgi:hypothetical protein